MDPAGEKLVEIPSHQLTKLRILQSEVGERLNKKRTHIARALILNVVIYQFHQEF